jgi:hypothetical protein
MNNQNVPTEEIREQMAETIVISWIGQETSPPVHLADLVGKYRNLVAYMDHPNTPIGKSHEAGAAADRLYDQIMSAAKLKIEISARAEAQIRRIQRKEEARWTYQQKCDHAIALYRAGVRFDANGARV